MSATPQSIARTRSKRTHKAPERFGTVVSSDPKDEVTLAQPITGQPKTKQKQKTTTTREAKPNPKPEPEPEPTSSTSAATKKKASKGADLPKKSSAGNEMEKALAALKKSEEDAKKICIEDIRELKRDFNKAIDRAKRAAQEQEEREALKKPAKSTRSGLKRGALKKIDEYTQGKIIISGMRAAQNTFAEDELEYLRREVPKVKQVKDLKFEFLQYLVSYVFLPELKSIQKGETKSEFHDRYNELIGKSKNDLYAEMRLSLFTNEQRDFLNGYLQEVFGANKKDERGDINHELISYVELVMLYETTLRIVKYVHKFATFEETLEFMKKKSREAYGISDDEE
jgi:hypothetical protein